MTFATAALTLFLAGCTTQGTGAEEAFLAEHDLAGMDAQDIVDHLDRLDGAQRPTDLMASVGTEELLLTDGEEELSLGLPEERFYLSLAPYVSQTHECYNHSLTTCQGELIDADVQVTVLDDEGEVLLDEQRTTFDNGFIGLWLPRQVDGTIRLSSEGQSGEVDFSTRDDSPTCLTTLQLA